tara:strand:+ start:1264 stop:1599 length:336 start_codon:yes stop_codon:yes gene_type:complete
MVHKNYKWNITLEEGNTLIFNTIYQILKERTDHCIELSELSLVLNNRTKNIDIKNNNKPKQLINFIKINHGSILYFTENYKEFNHYEIKERHFIKLNEFIENEWIFVESDE